MAVPWLADLEDALFAQLPAHEDRFVWEATTYTCDRSLEERGTDVFFVETWGEAHSGAPRHTWRLQLNPGAWVGAVAPQQASAIARLCTSIAQARPRQQVRTPPPALVPSRFGVEPS